MRVEDFKGLVIDYHPTMVIGKVFHNLESYVFHV